VFPGEDGPQPISTGITVVDKQGKVVQKIKVDDRLLSNFQWAKDSPALGFMTSLVVEEGFSSGEETYSGYFPQAAYDGIWLVQVDGKFIPEKIAEIPKDASGKTAHAYLMAVDVRGKGVFCNIYKNEERSLWYAEKGKEPLKLTDGSLFSYNRAPVYGDTLVGTVTEGDKVVIWLFEPGKFRKLAEYNGAAVIAFNDTLMVVSTLGYDPSQQGKGRVTIFKMWR